MTRCWIISCIYLTLSFVTLARSFNEADDEESVAAAYARRGDGRVDGAAGLNWREREDLLENFRRHYDSHNNKQINYRHRGGGAVREYDDALQENYMRRPAQGEPGASYRRGPNGHHPQIRLQEVKDESEIDGANRGSLEMEGAPKAPPQIKETHLPIDEEKFTVKNRASVVASRQVATPLQQNEMEHRSKTDVESSGMYFIALVAGCSAAAVCGVIAAGFCWYKFQKNAKAAAEAEYPAYGVTGPNKDHVSPSGGGDRKLAHSAQMYHYQHQKQQMIAMEKSNGERQVSTSDLDSEDDNEEGDYTVYECPGLAPTGEMEVKNPLFQDDSSVPSSPPVLTKPGDLSSSRNEHGF